MPMDDETTNFESLPEDVDSADLESAKLESAQRLVEDGQDGSNDQPVECDSGLREIDQSAVDLFRLLDRVQKRTPKSFVFDTEPLKEPAPNGSTPADAHSKSDDTGVISERNISFGVGTSSGDKLCGFEIIRRLGIGGHGLVFLARDPKLNRQVAIKLPRPDVLLSATAMSRLVREAEAVAQLNHPGIVQIYEIVSDEAIPIIVYEYCEGCSLREYLEQVKMIEQRVAATLVRDIARALQHAHESDITHRDLKPENILLSGIDPQSRMDEQVALGAARLVDFGLAKISDDAPITLTGELLGTPQYMSPEQIDGRTFAQSDLFSLGVVLYEMVTGQLPFQGESWLAVAAATRDHTPPPMRHQVADVHRDLDAICTNCLKKNPQHRYPLAGMLADDLDRFLTGQPVSVRRRTAWRSPIAALIAGLVAILIVGFATRHAGLGASSVSDAQVADEQDAITREKENRDPESNLAEDVELLAAETQSGQSALLSMEQLRAQLTQTPNDIDLLCRLAATLGRKQQWKESLRIADQALSVESSPKTLATKAMAHYQLGNVADAIEGVNEALDINPDHPQALMTLATLRLTLRRQYRDPNLAMDLILRAADSIDDAQSLAHRALHGVACYHLGEYEDAIALLDESTVDELDDDVVKLYRCLVLHGLRQRLTCTVAIETALQDIQPSAIWSLEDQNWVTALSARVLYRLKDRKYDEMATQMKVLGREIQKNPESYEHHFTRCILRYRMFDYEGALRDAQRCVELQPENYLSYFWRGESHYYMQSEQLALKDYQKSIDLNPSHSQSTRRYAGILACGPPELRDTRRAAEMIKTYRRDFPDGYDYPMYTTEAMAMFQEEQYARARRVFEDGPRSVNDYAMPKYQLAICYLRTGSPNMALAKYRLGARLIGNRYWWPIEDYLRERRRCEDELGIESHLIRGVGGEPAKKPDAAQADADQTARDQPEAGPAKTDQPHGND